MWRILRSLTLLGDVNYNHEGNSIVTEDKGKDGEVYVGEVLSTYLLHGLKTSSKLFF